MYLAERRIMLYRFNKGNPIGICRVKNLQICWYDMTQDGDCFDESFAGIKAPLQYILSYVETEEDKGKDDRSRVFVNMDNGDVYELVMRKVKSLCGNFDDK